jgi:hypothetical protein
MHPVYFVLSSYDLRTAPDLVKLESFDEARLRELHARIYEALGPATYDEPESKGILDPFKFVASASMRGESGCTSPYCRFRKLDLLNRFGALYATTVVLPIGMTSPKFEIDLSVLKTQVEYACFVLLVSRYLVNSGYFIPTSMRTSHYCEHETEFVRKSKEMMWEMIEDSIPDFAKLFRVRYQQSESSPSGLPSIYIDGPEDLLEHGSMVYRQPNGIGPKFSKRRRFDSEGMTEIRGKDKYPFLWPILDQIGNNTSFYLAFRMRHNARLITDLPGEAILLQDLGEDERFYSSTMGLNALTHALPLLSALPLEKLLEIRAENREAFEAYRISVSKMTQKAIKDGLSTDEASDYFVSELLPAIESIKREVALEKKKQRRRLVAGVGSIAAGLAIGAISGIPHLASLPAAATGAVGALVGGNFLKKAAESECEHDADLQRQNDLYFLMKVLDTKEE